MQVALLAGNIDRWGKNPTANRLQFSPPFEPEKKVLIIFLTKAHRSLCAQSACLSSFCSPTYSIFTSCKVYFHVSFWWNLQQRERYWVRVLQSATITQPLESYGWDDSIGYDSALGGLDWHSPDRVRSERLSAKLKKGLFLKTADEPHVIMDQKIQFINKCSACYTIYYLLQ